MPTVRPGMVRSLCMAGKFSRDDLTDLACHRPVEGDWHIALSTGTGWSTKVWKGGPVPGPWIERRCVSGYFNSDGQTDLACYTDRTDWHMALSELNGYVFPVWRNGPIVEHSLPGQCLTGYFDQNRLTDLACRPSDGPWHIALSTGFGWQRSTWSSGPIPGEGTVHRQCVTGHFNDDEMTDLACYHANGIWRMALSSSRGYSFPSWSRGATPTNVADQCVTGKFDNNVTTDLACHIRDKGWVVTVSTGRGWQASSWQDGPILRHPVKAQCVVGNLNHDLLTDLACYTGQDGTWDLWLSSSRGYGSAAWQHGPSPEWPIDHQCITSDFTGNTITDLACYSGTGNIWNMAIPP